MITTQPPNKINEPVQAHDKSEYMSWGVIWL